MLFPSHTLARLIEPALQAVSYPRGDRIRPVLSEARSLMRTAKDALRERGGDLDPLSFELGVGTAFVEMLATVEQRSVLGDAVRVAESAQRGLETLHVIGFLSRASVDATQGELADRLRIDRGNFSRLVRSLEDAGLVKSKRTGRKLTYELPPLGVDALSYLRPGWKAIHPQTSHLLDTEDEAVTVANTIAGNLQRSIEQDQSGASELMGLVFGRSGAGVKAPTIFGITRSSGRTSFGSAGAAPRSQQSFEYRAA